MTDTMTPGEALDVLQQLGVWCADGGTSDAPVRMHEIRAALAVLREHHAYMSRWRMGQYFYTPHDGHAGKAMCVRNVNFEGVSGKPYINGIPESDCFATYDEAEAAKKP